MPRIAKPLTALEVRRLTAAGLHAVGTVSGLCLLVKPSGARSWVLRTTIGSRRAELGLGGFPAVTLAMAHERAREALNRIRAGADPAAERRARRLNIVWTFRRTAEDYIAVHRAGWKNAKHADQWHNTLEAYAYPLFGQKHVRDVTKADVLAAIEPLWATKNETASRLRSRIELVLGYAMQRELRPEGLNPARWRDNLDATLPRRGRVRKVEHLAALPIDAMQGFMLRLRALDGMGARALEFAILTAARSGEVRGAAWAEIDLDGGVWSIPAARMKAARPHRVPLSTAAMDLLRALPRFADEPLVFPGAKGALSDMTLTAVLRRLKVPVTVHGFRSTFRDWCAERTAVPAEVAEMALAHTIGDQTEAAYRRGDLFEKRRDLMQQWARFVMPQPATPQGGDTVDAGNRATAGKPFGGGAV